jgi:hypothetical protein
MIRERTEEMGFELWKPMRLVGGCACVRITKEGLIYFNCVARVTLFGAEYKNYRLYFDRRGNQIGFERLTGNGEYSKPILRKKNGEAFKSGLCARGFFAFFGLDTKKIAGKYLIEVAADRALMVIQLPKV